MESRKSSNSNLQVTHTHKHIEHSDQPNNLLYLSINWDIKISNICLLRSVITAEPRQLTLQQRNYNVPSQIQLSMKQTRRNSQLRFVSR